MIDFMVVLNTGQREWLICGAAFCPSVGDTVYMPRYVGAHLVKSRIIDLETGKIRLVVEAV